MGLITARPVAVKLKRVKSKQTRESIWAKQSRSVKAALISLFFLIVTGFVYYYNLFTTESYLVRLETAQMEAEIERKNILIPDLAKVVEDYMAFEGRVFVHAVDVRSALAPFKELADGGSSQLLDMQKFRSAISRFQAVAENYPALKSSETYQNLMLQLANTETRLTNSRYSYNSAVNRYNTSLELLPGCFFGYALGFKPTRTFTADKSR